MSKGEGEGVLYQVATMIKESVIGVDNISFN